MMLLIRYCFIYCFFVSLTTLPVFATGLNDTGQTHFFDNTSQLPEPPDSYFNTPFTGQDASYQGQPHSYTKISAAGEILPDNAPTWSMVRDNVSGLYWEVKNNSDGVADFNNPHDIDNTYTWYNANPYENNGNPGQIIENATTEDFIDSLNEAAFGGFQDWRLPTASELSRLCEHDELIPKPNTNFFPNNRSYAYWSANTAAIFPAAAWWVNFFTGKIGTNGKNELYHVRAVRGCKLVSQMFVNDDSTVFDQTTGLTWHPPIEGERTWQDALNICEGSIFSGKSDWRLPNINELQTLIDYSQSFPSFSRRLFPHMASAQFWSSTTKPERDDIYNKAWVVEFSDGRVEYKDKSEKHYYLFVRGGQNFKTAATEIDEFSASPQSGEAPLTVTFSCQATPAAGRTIQAYHWDFDGDGVTDQVTEGNVVSCSYPASGSYSATCLVYNDHQQAQKSAPISIAVTTAALPHDYTYYLPYFRALSEPLIWTGLALANSSVNSDTFVDISVFDQQGQVLVEKYPIFLATHGQVSRSIAAGTDGQGWIQVESSNPLTGLAFVGSNYMADIPFVDKLSTSLVIPHIAQNESWDTIILICNPNKEPNRITFGNYYRERQGVSSGYILRNSIRTLPAMGSANYLLSEIFTGTIEGMITITAEHGMAAFALYTDQKSGGHYYAGINAVQLNQIPTSN